MWLTGILIVGVVLHFLFMAGEMFPWNKPFILGEVLKDTGINFDDRQQKLVSTIVHNAGIYNFILTAGFAWCLFASNSHTALDESAVKLIQTFFLSGATIAGLFGITLNIKTVAQALVGMVGLVVLYWG